MQGNLLFQLLLVTSDVLKLWGEGGVLVGLALARPTKAFTTSKPLSLTIQPASGLGSTEGELGGTEVASALAVRLPGILLNTGAVLLSNGVAGGGAEGDTKVATRGKQGSQVVQADRALAALAFTFVSAKATGLSKGDTTCSACPFAQRAPEASQGRRRQSKKNNEEKTLAWCCHACLFACLS